jgi:hypothetical protein
MGFFFVVFGKLSITLWITGMNSSGFNPDFLQVSWARYMLKRIISLLMVLKIRPSTMLLRMKFSKDSLSICVSDGTATSRPKGWTEFPTLLCDNERCDATSVPGMSDIVYGLQMYTGI